jgi:hypothetical protein
VSAPPDAAASKPGFQIRPELVSVAPDAAPSKPGFQITPDASAPAPAAIPASAPAARKPPLTCRAPRPPRPAFANCPVLSPVAGPSSFAALREKLDEQTASVLTAVSERTGQLLDLLPAIRDRFDRDTEVLEAKLAALGRAIQCYSEVLRHDAPVVPQNPLEQVIDRRLLPEIRDFVAGREPGEFGDELDAMEQPTVLAALQLLCRVRWAPEMRGQAAKWTVSLLGQIRADHPAARGVVPMLMELVRETFGEGPLSSTILAMSKQLSS